MASASPGRKRNIWSGFAGIFRNRSLRNKIILTFLLVTLLSIGGITYVNNRATSEQLTTQAGQNLEELAAARALNIGTMLARNVDAVQSFSLGTNVRGKVEVQNSIYAGQFENEWAVRSELRERDNLWQDADENDAFKQGRLDNSLARDLHEFAETFPGISELVVTDRYGGLTAASFVSPDYYQGDETWWQNTYNRGDGQVFISDPQLHPGGRRIIRVAVPIFSNTAAEAGEEAKRETVGVIGGLLDTSLLADILQDTDAGQTGAAELMFQTNSSIFGPRDGEYTFYSTSEPGAQSMSALERAPRGNTQMTVFGRESFVAHAPITSLEENPYIEDLGWQVIVHQNKSEALQIVEDTTRNTSLLAAAIAAIVIFVGVVMGQHFARPILTLSEAMTRFTGGELSTRVHIKTGDETGTLAKRFNEMADQMSGLFQQLDSRRNELEQRTRQLDANQRAISVIFAASKQSGPEELLGLVVDMIRDQFDLYHVQIYMLDDAGENAVLREGTGYAGRQLMQQGHNIPLDQPALVSRAITQDEPVIVEDVNEAEDFLANPLLPDTESELVVPLRLDNHVIGALDVQSNRKHKFNRDMITLFQTMAEQIAFLFENSELLQQVSEQNEALTRFTTQLRTAAELGQRLGTIYEPDELLHETVELIQSRFGFYHAHIYLLNPQEGELVVHAGSGEVGRVLREKGHSIPINADKSLVARAAGNKDSVLVNDVSLESDFLPNPLLPQTRSEVAVPLIVRGEVLGVLDVQDDQADRFDESDVNALNTLAGQVATALNSARLFEQLQNTLEQTRVRLQANEALSTARTEKQVLETICEQASLYEDVQVTVFLVDEEDEETYFEIYDSRALNSGLTELRSGQRFPISELALRNYDFDEVTFVSENALEDERVGEGVRTLMRDAGATSIAVVRIQVGEDWFGILTITSPNERNFDHHRIQLYELLAERGALALREARLREQLTRIGQAIENTGDAIVISDINGEAVYNNRAFTDLFGYTLDELNESGGAVALYHSEDDARRIFGEAASGGSWNGELDMRSKAGTVIPVELRVDAFRDDDGNVAGAIGTMTDITERRTLREAGAVVAATLQRDEAIQRILEQLNQVVDHDSASVQLLHDGEMEIVGGHGWQSPDEDIIGLRFPIPGDNPNTLVVEERRPIVLNSPQEIGEYASFGEAPHAHIHSWMGVPLIFRGTVTGMLAMESTRENAFSSSDAQLVSAFGDHVAIAIENSRLFEQTEETLDRIRTAAEITEQLSGVLDPDELLHDIVDVLRSRFSLYHVHVYLLDDERENLVMRAGSGEVGQKLRERGHAIPRSREQSLVARAAREHTTIHVDDTSKDPNFMPNPLLPDTQSEVAVPLVSRGKLIGVLDVQDNYAGRFDDTDLDTLNTIAGQIATAIENARLFEEAEEALESLRTSEERFRFLSEETNEGVIVHDQGTIIDVNEAGAQMFGYKRPELIGQNALVLTTDESREIVKQNMLSDASEPYEAHGERKDGSTLIAQIQGRPAVYQGQEVRVAIVRDITQQREAEEEMRRLNTMLVTQQETSPDGILIVNPDREFVFFNNRFTDIWEIPDSILESESSEEALAHVRQQLKYPDEFVERTNELYANRERSREEIELKDGRILDRFSAPMVGNDGEYYGRMWTFRDITERKRAERELENQRAFLRQVLDLNPHFIFAKDHQGHFTLANKALADAYGTTPAELIGKTDADFSPTEDEVTHFREDDRRVIENREEVFIPEEQITDIQGNERWLQTTKIPIVEGGEVTQLLGVSIDITERRRAQEALQESQEHYQTLFEDAPIALWEEDFSEVKDYIDQLRREGVEDFDTYLEENPDAVMHGASLVKIMDINETTTTMFNAADKPDVLQNLDQIFGPESLVAFKKEMVAIANNETSVSMQGINFTLDGDKLYVDIKWNVAPGYEEAYDRVLVAITDLTQQKEAEQALMQSQTRYQTLFEDAPISLWEEDFSEVKRYIDQLREDGVEDFETYFAENPEEIQHCASLVKILDVNQTTVELYKADDKKDLLANLDKVFGPGTEEAFVQELIAISRGETHVDTEGTNFTLEDEKKFIDLKWNVAPGHHDTYARVLVAITDLTRQKEIEEAMAQRLQYEERLAASSQALLSGDDIDERLGQVLDHLRNASGACRVYFFKSVESLQEGSYARQTHESCAPNVEPQIDNPILQHFSYEELGFTDWSKQLSSGKLVAGTIDQFDEQQREVLDSQGIKSVLLLPVHTSNGWYGSIGFDDTRHKREWTPEDIRLLRTAAELIGNAAERAEAQQELTRFTNQLRTAAEISEQINSILDPQQLLPEVVTLLQKRFDLYHVHIYLLDDEHSELRMESGSGSVGRKLREQGHAISFDEEQSLVARAAREQTEILVGDTHEEPAFMPNPLLPDTRSEVALPLVARGDVIGVLDVQDDMPARFRNTDVDALSTVASQIATALDNARLFEEIQQTAERLREVDRLKSEFLANMSHELRTPLNSIIGYAEIMLMGIDGELDDETLQDVQAIHENGQHLLELINDILDLAKIEAGRMKLDREPVQISTLFEEVKTSHLGVLHQQKKRLDLEIDVEEQLPPVNVDYSRFNQVLNNLVSNAIKFTDEGKIVMRAAKDNGWLRVEVKDSGVGISRTDQRRIFERFRQVDGSSTRAAEGTGLGLAITHHLVEMHGGTIDVESELGEGSTFIVRLPIHIEAGEDAE